MKGVDNFFMGTYQFVKSMIILALLCSYTYWVARVSMQAGMDAQGNLVKQKFLQVTFGVTPPESGGFLGFDLKALTEGRCVPEEKTSSVVEN